jgi:hypothetical protein
VAHPLLSSFRRSPLTVMKSVSMFFAAAFLLRLVVAVAALENPAVEVKAALTTDDICLTANGVSDCALNALQTTGISKGVSIKTVDKETSNTAVESHSTYHACPPEAQRKALCQKVDCSSAVCFSGSFCAGNINEHGGECYCCQGIPSAPSPGDFPDLPFPSTPSSPFSQGFPPFPSTPSSPFSQGFPPFPSIPSSPLNFCLSPPCPAPAPAPVQSCPCATSNDLTGPGPKTCGEQGCGCNDPFQSVMTIGDCNVCFTNSMCSNLDIPIPIPK